MVAFPVNVLCPGCRMRWVGRRRAAGASPASRLRDIRPAHQVVGPRTGRAGQSSPMPASLGQLPAGTGAIARLSAELPSRPAPARAGVSIWPAGTHRTVPPACPPSLQVVGPARQTLHHRPPGRVGQSLHRGKGRIQSGGRTIVNHLVNYIKPLRVVNASGQATRTLFVIARSARSSRAHRGTWQSRWGHTPVGAPPLLRQRDCHPTLAMTIRDNRKTLGGEGRPPATPAAYAIMPELSSVFSGAR